MQMEIGRSVAATLMMATLCAGCAPQFIDVRDPVVAKQWVQRPALVISDQTGTVASEEFVFSKPRNTVIGPDERVRWISGVDPVHSKFQRSSQRLIATTDRTLGNGNKADPLVDIQKFEITGDQLSVEGRLHFDRFSAKSTDRYYVEFLNKGAMNETDVNNMMEAWNALSTKLKYKGLNTSSVVMGGSKYGQDINAIVLVKVGK